MWGYCFFPSELQKYQKMLEPPPSAKPFIVDVDKKLEEGQKVISFLRYQSSHFFFFQFVRGFGYEAHGTPLQYSCLENPMDGGA